MGESRDERAPAPRSPAPVELGEPDWRGVRSAGLVLVEPAGGTWIRKPTGHYGEYIWTWPKGRLDASEHPQAAAHRETFEETGLTGRITALLGDYGGDTGVTRFYLAERVGGSPVARGETSAVVLATWDEAANLLHRKRDLDVLAEARTRLAHG